MNPLDSYIQEGLLQKGKRDLNALIAEDIIDKISKAWKHRTNIRFSHFDHFFEFLRGGVNLDTAIEKVANAVQNYASSRARQWANHINVAIFDDDEVRWILKFAADNWAMENIRETNIDKRVMFNKVIYTIFNMKQAQGKDLLNVKKVLTEYNPDIANARLCFINDSAGGLNSYTILYTTYKENDSTKDSLTKLLWDNWQLGM